MRTLWRSALTTIALVAIVVAAGAPARADVVSRSCEDGSRHFMNAWVFVTEIGPHHQWHRFDYELGGINSDKNNVDLWVVFGQDVPYWNKSPDNLRAGVPYTVIPPWPVYTWADAVEYTFMTATFDVFGPDPTCDVTVVM